MMHECASLMEQKFTHQKHQTNKNHKVTIHHDISLGQLIATEIKYNLEIGFLCSNGSVIKRACKVNNLKTGTSIPFGLVLYEIKILHEKAEIAFKGL